MRQESIKYYFIVFILLLSQLTYSQVKRIGIPHVRNYSPSDIQAGAQTWMIDISQDGLAYFANNDGILEFDAIQWRKHPLPGGIVVRCVKTMKDGKIYAGGFNQIGYFERNNDGKLIFNSLQSIIPAQYQNFGEVWKIHELPRGIVFQSYEQLMIYHNGEITILKAPESFHFSFLVNGELFINDYQEGLYRLANDRFVKIQGVDRLNGQLIWAMLPKGDNILIATTDNGIFEFDGLNITAWETSDPGILRQNQVYCGIAINERIYAFGTIQDGLILCDTAGNILQHINLERGLQNSTILSMQLDQYGNLWLGLDNGIDYVEINSPLTYFTHFNNLSAGYTAILHEGMLYYGTNRGVFYHDWDDLQNSTGDQKFKIVEGTQGQVWDLQVFDGTLFCGHTSGIFIISGTKSRKVSDVHGGWTFLQPKDRDDLLICGTYTSLVKFKKQNGEWLNGVAIKGFNESSRFLVNAGKNTIWMSHGYLGVFRIHFNDDYDSVTKVEVYNSQHGFPSNENINVFDFLGKAVFTTDDGIYEYDIRTNSFVPDQNIMQLLNQNDIREFQRDRKGNIWYFTMEDAGVYRVQEDGSYFNLEVPFRELSGRFIRWFQFVYPLDDKNVFFGIQDGFVHYSPEFPKNYTLGLRSFIREVELSVQDSIIFYGGPIDNEMKNAIPFKYNQLQFEFSANDFENPESIQFSTYLEGFEEEWSPWQSRSSREFTNLKHGNHTFKVKAKNIFNTESNVSSITFEIQPPWYLKWWGYTLYALASAIFIIALIFYVRNRMHKSKRQEEERQQRIYKEREKQLKTEALENEKEVIKLRNEKLHLEMIQKDKELANSTMEMIHKSKSLISIKKELSKLTREVRDDSIKDQINLLIRKVNREIDTQNQWEVFEKHFESVHEKFLKDLKSSYPSLTPREMKLCAYLRLNISSKEIATLMNISTRGVEISRYRLRKKFNLDRSANLTTFIMSF